jgi:glycerate kinase
VENQLLGEFGATAQYGPQKGLPKEEIGLFESEIKSLLNLLQLQEPKTFDLAKVNGTGAAGGMGFGLSLFYDVSLVQGFELISSWFEIENKIKQADFVITAEGRFDQTSMDGKGPYQIIRTSQRNSTASLVIAGSIDDKVVEQASKNFPDCSFVSFGRSDWTIEKNLSSARENFISTLEEFPIPHLI